MYRTLDGRCHLAQAGRLKVASQFTQALGVVIDDQPRPLEKVHTLQGDNNSVHAIVEPGTLYNTLGLTRPTIGLLRPAHSFVLKLW